MGGRTLGVLVPVLMIAELMSSGARAQEGRRALPANLEIHPALQIFVDRAWERSPTFRRQCSRLAAESHVRVQLLLEDQPARPLEFHAQSLLMHDGATLASARVRVRPGPDAIAHIAHELEHVIEQLDGVDLRDHQASGMAWKSVGGSYETRRAIGTGSRVAAEATRNGPIVGSGSRMPHIETSQSLRLRQRDRASTWGARPSARVSANGRHVVFVSSAPLVDADRNDLADIYVFDLITRQLSLESGGAAGAPADGWSANPDISGDGRFVVFESAAGNLTGAPMRPGHGQVFLRDRHQKVTRLLSVNERGEPPRGFSRHAAISADGTSVVFEEAVAEFRHERNTPALSVGIYLVRVASGERVRVDVPVSGAADDGVSMSPAISATAALLPSSRRPI